jgi:putative RNA 2'-phosphotransferase
MVGARHGKPLVLTVLTEEMYSDGMAFYLSENGVWLTEAVPAKYLKFEANLEST